MIIKVIPKIKIYMNTPADKSCDVYIIPAATNKINQ